RCYAKPCGKSLVCAIFLKSQSESVRVFEWFSGCLIPSLPSMVVFSEEIGQFQSQGGYNIWGRATCVTFEQHPSILTGADAEARVSVIVTWTFSDEALARFLE